ncbi:uncharacterized protein EDB93DRAFT_1183697, partial [Suillus bovinus]|uniref:uncharacterized protein n=1 Tax=Suillus bovinus TaxID=48563 RepID=UPI001B86C2B0
MKFCRNRFQHIKASRCSTVPFKFLSYHITASQKMHFSFVLAVVTALIATVSATDTCHNLCNEVSCCAGQTCTPTFVQALNAVVDYC